MQRVLIVLMPCMHNWWNWWCIAFLALKFPVICFACLYIFEYLLHYLIFSFLWCYIVCRKCIYKKLSDEEMECCPICNIDLGCVPLEKLRSVQLYWFDLLDIVTYVFQLNYKQGYNLCKSTQPFKQAFMQSLFPFVAHRKACMLVKLSGFYG